MRYNVNNSAEGEDVSAQVGVHFGRRSDLPDDAQVGEVVDPADVGFDLGGMSAGYRPSPGMPRSPRGSRTPRPSVNPEGYGIVSSNEVSGSSRVSFQADVIGPGDDVEAGVGGDGYLGTVIINGQVWQRRRKDP